MATRTTAAPVLRRGFADAILNHLSGSDTTSLTLTPVVHLIGATPPSVTPDTTLASFTAAEAAFSGYGAASVTLSGPVNPGPNSQALAAGALYIGNSTTTFNQDTITGYYTTSGGNWQQAELFADGQQVPIAANGDFLDLLLLVTLSLRPPLT